MLMVNISLGFIIILDDKIYLGFFNETTKEMILSNFYDLQNVSCFLFDGVAKSKVHITTEGTTTLSGHFYVGVIDTTIELNYGSLFKTDWTGKKYIDRMGYKAHDSHFYHPSEYPIKST